MHPDFGVLGRRGPPRQPALGAIGPGVAADDGRGRQVTLKTANIGTAVDVEATLAAPPPTRSTGATSGIGGSSGPVFYTVSGQSIAPTSTINSRFLHASSTATIAYSGRTSLSACVPTI